MKNFIFRFISLSSYISIFIIIYKNKDVFPAPFGELTRDLTLLSIALVSLTILIELLRNPLGKKKFDKAFKKIGLKNHLNEYPELISSKKDKHKEHGIIYTIKNKGISIVDFDNKTHSLETALNLKIYKLDFGKTTKKIKIYAVPYKYNTPLIISSDSTCTNFVENMINLLCVGATGTGKSYALLTILGLFSQNPTSTIVICDYKKSSFSQFESTKNFYGYEDVANGIKSVYKEFSERLQENNQERNKNRVILLIDEYGAFISSQDKKTAEDFKSMIGNMLFMGRSLGIIILIGIQRADSSEYFKGGARDQFRTILAMGNLSKEQKNMLFYEYKDKLSHNNSLGEGYLLVDGKGVERIKIAPIKDIEALNKNIMHAMNR
ncbi:MAG: hypothetical protein E7522_02860 [Ruminococcaceae bacterium]|nr:hypothetical protein [Oscillospiraceae bacterium]